MKSARQSLTWRSGRTLNTMSSSIMEINPDVAEAHRLRGWFDSSPKQFKAQSAGSFSGSGGGGFNRNELRFFADVRDAELGMNGDKPEYFSARGTIMHVRSENLAYPACRTDGCSKKVIEQHDGWRCEKCEKTWDKPSYRFVHPSNFVNLRVYLTDCLPVRSSHPVRADTLSRWL